MDKLPATSYVRLVDIWLIFVQLYPFIEENLSDNVAKIEYHKYFVKKALLQGCLTQVVLITIIEMHVEEEITNNHGRLKRFVPEPESQNKVCIFF